MLTAVAAVPATAQTPLGLDGKASEQATTPVAQVVEPVSGVTEQVAAAAVEPVSRATEQVAAAAVEPVSRATEQVVAAVEPVSLATEQVAAASEPLTRAAGRVAAAAEPVLDATGRVAGAAKPVLDATAGVAAPAVRLGAAAGDVVDDLARPVGGALTGERASRPDRESTRQPVATFGRPGSGGPSSGGGDGAGSERPAAGGLAAEGTRAAAPDTSLGGMTPGSAPDQPLTTAATDERPTTATGRPPGAPAVGTGYLSALLSLPGLADAIAPPSPETSTSAPTDRRPAQISPERQPTPAPTAPAGGAAAGAASAGSAAPMLALLALLLLAATGLSLFLRTVPEFLRPAPFIVALERPG